MEQQQLPLIEATDQAMAPTDAPGLARSAPTITTTTTTTPGRPSRKDRRGVGSTRPAKGSRADDWRINEHTRAVGREGVAAARALLNRTNRAA
jgi:hypothetical protein